MRNLQLYATASATANAVAQLTIPSATRIKGVHLSIAVDSVSDNALVQLEFSKIPTRQITTNGAQDPFMSLNIINNLLTSGMAQSGGLLFIPLDVECRQGEFIYLHALITGTATFYATAIFSF